MTGPFLIRATRAKNHNAVKGLVSEDIDLETHLTPTEGRAKAGSVLLPCILDDTGLRVDEHVTHMTAIVADLDHMSLEVYESSLDAVETRGLAAIAYETWSHKPPEDCRLRVWYPFDTPLALEGIDWPATWSALLAYLGHAESKDAKCKNPSHIYYDARYPAGQSRECYIFDGPSLDPVPFVVWSGAPRAAPVPTTPRAPEGEGIPIDREELCARWLAQCGADLKPFATKIARGESVGVDGSGRRDLYLRGAASLMGVLKPEEDTATVREVMYRPSWLADCKVAGPEKHPWEAIEALFTDSMREKFSPESRAEYRAAQDARRKAEAERALALLAKLSPSAPPLAAPPSASEGQANAEAPRVPLARLTPPPGESCFPDEDSARNAITNAAECPVPIDAGGDCYVAEWCAAPTRQDPKARVFKAVDYDAFTRQLKGLAYLPTEGRNPKPKSAADLWLNASQLRRVGIVCTDSDAIKAEHPYALNLWRGLAVAQAPGDITPMQEVVTRLAGGDTVGAEYMVRWLSWVVQHPTDLPETALVLKGPQGCGKSFLAESMRRMFGEHGRIVTSAKGLVGDFNARLVGACFVLAEEVSLLKAEANERVKALITSEVIDIEFKGKDQFETNNAIALMMLTNNDRALCVTEDDRRWAVYDSLPLLHPYNSHDHIAMWRARHHWLNHGGLQAWAHYLANNPLGDWHPRDRPSGMAGLKREAEHTQDEGPLGWLAEVTDHGVLREGGESHPLKPEGSWFPTDQLWAAYLDWCKQRQATRVPTNRNTFGKLLALHWQPSRGNVPGQGQRHGYRAPPEGCRWDGEAWAPLVPREQ